VILLDETRRVIEMNPAALLLTGASREEVRGVPIGTMLAARDTFAAEGAHPGRAGTGMEGFGERPAALLTSDGRRVPIALSQTNVWDEFGQVAGSVLLARDLRRTEEMQARLVQSEKLASIGQVAAGVAHEVNNPTTYILTNVRRLRTLADEVQVPASTEALAESASQIRDIALDCEEGAIRIKNIVASLSAFSRMPTNRLEPVDVNAVIESALKIVDLRMRPVADLDRDFGEVPRVMGDTGALGQVMLNLALNAVQAVEATGRRGRIEIRTSTNRETVLVDFQDDGTGIPAEVLPHVFDPFFTTKRAGEGTGLGLAICLDIVRRHGGDIVARSAGRGQGAEFIVRLPLAAAPPAVEEEPSLPPPAPSRRRVLVVDDNVDAAQTLAAYLRMEGHRVESALDGEAALRIAEVLHPDIAFIDLNMPRMDGVEVARRLRVTPWGRSARLVALTGLGQPSDIERTREAGFDEHITKPADLGYVARLAASGAARTS
jgi:PAS domain S-box-containing protein